LLSHSILDDGDFLMWLNSIFTIFVVYTVTVSNINAEVLMNRNIVAGVTEQKTRAAVPAPDNYGWHRPRLQSGRFMMLDS
uniref:PKD_channel domain-containing protein n=1 Tax=Haemonchus contortus TaxID=6289 RepID=A0A6F7PEX2_HAECO